MENKIKAYPKNNTNVGLEKPKNFNLIRELNEFRLCLRLPSGLLPPGLPTKTL